VAYDTNIILLFLLFKYVDLKATTYFFVVVARNFPILHPIIEDAASGQIWHLSTMPGAEHCNINYSVGCSSTP
jgi:hypothetical protein